MTWNDHAKNQSLKESKKNPRGMIEVAADERPRNEINGGGGDFTATNEVA